MGDTTSEHEPAGMPPDVGTPSEPRLGRTEPPSAPPSPSDSPAPPATLAEGAGRPIAPPAPAATPWVPGQPWRAGGGVHGHDRPASAQEPLTAVTGTTVRRSPAVAAEPHAAGPMPSNGRTGAIIAGSVLAALIGALLALGGAALLGAFDDPDPVVVAPTRPAEVVEITEIVTAEDPTQATAVGIKVVPSIVTIEVGSDAGPNGFLVVGSGSGVVLNDEGAIATNHHVIDGADDARVILQDGRIYDATVVGSDELTDLAVLQIDRTGLTPIELGATEGLVIGEPAIAVGNPLGLTGGASLTVGVVSAFEREVVVAPEVTLFGMLQTDAPITNGSSGGALVDGTGRLIGITTAIGVSEAGAEGIGFAIPVELVVRITDELLERGDVSHAFLGVSLRNYLEADGPAQVPAGALISSIEEDSSAERFDLEIDDRIVAVDDVEILTDQDVINTLRFYRVGDVVTLTIVRDGTVVSIEVELGERPDGM